MRNYEIPLDYIVPLTRCCVVDDLMEFHLFDSCSDYVYPRVGSLMPSIYIIHFHTYTGCLAIQQTRVQKYTSVLLFSLVSSFTRTRVSLFSSTYLSFSLCHGIMTMLIILLHMYVYTRNPTHTHITCIHIKQDKTHVRLHSHTQHMYMCQQQMCNVYT